MKARIKHALVEGYVGMPVGNVELIERQDGATFLTKKFLDNNRVYWCTINGRTSWKREKDLLFIKD